MGSNVPLRTTKYCANCGYVLDIDASSCVRCGAPQGALALANQSERKLLPASLLCFLLGVFGAHRFYAGKTGTGVLQLVTLGGVGLWWLYDLIMLLTGSFTDKEGRKISAWM